MSTGPLPLLLSSVATEFGSQPSVGDVRLSNYSDESPDGVLPVSLSELINLSAETILISSADILDSSFTSATAGIRFNNTGYLEKYKANSGGYSAIAAGVQWANTEPNTIGADYEIEVVITDGNIFTTTAGSGAGNWINLGTTRYWDCSVSASSGTIETKICTATWSIRKVGTTTVLSTDSIRLTARSDSDL